MTKYQQILKLLIDWFGDEFEDGELDALIFDIIEATENK